LELRGRKGQEASVNCITNIIRVIRLRRMRWVGHVAHTGEMRSAHTILIGQSEWKRRLGKPRLRWEDNIRMDLKEIGWECVEWMYQGEDRDRWWALVNTVMSIRVP
jgi:hypothetical protein